MVADKTPVTKRTGLLKSSSIVSAMTMLSRVLGLLRDVLLARFIGADDNADAFFVAFKVPQFLRRLFAEGAFNQAFVPVLSEFKEQKGFDAVQVLINRVAASLGLAVFLVVSVVVVGAPFFVYLFAFGFSDNPEKLQLTQNLIQITFPYLFFITMTGFFGSIQNSYGRFAIPALTPVLLNLSLIVGVVWLSPQMQEPVYALAIAVFVAGALQMLFQVPPLMRLNLLPSPELQWRDEGVVRVIKLMIPAIFGVSVSQINLMFDTIIATFLPSGSVSWLYFSDRLAELPLGVFAVAIATVILPSLSRNHSAKSPEQFNSTMNWALALVILIALPAALSLIILAKPILMTLFLYGEMTVHDINMASLSMQAYALGLTAFMLIKVLAPGYFSRQDTKTPVRYGIIAMTSNMVLNVAFVVPLHMYWQIGHVGLALATAVSAALNAYLLYRGLVQRQVLSLSKQAIRLLLLAVLASAAMVAMLYFIQPDAATFSATATLSRVLHIAWVCGFGLAIYIAALLLFGLRPKHLRLNHFLSTP